MDIKELKEKIEQKILGDELIIFLCEENDFIPNQYIKEISRYKCLETQYVQNIEEMISKPVLDIFGASLQDNTLKVFKGNTLDYYNEKLTREVNRIIIVNKVSDDCKKLYKDFIVVVEKLDVWQMKDYLYSILPGLDRQYIDWLIENTNNNIYRLQQEADKLLLFNEKERNIIFKKMLEDDAFVDITSKNIFNFTNAITNKDKNSLKQVYTDIENIDIEPIGLVTVLYKNFKDIVSVQLTKNATAASLGMNQKKFNAIRYTCGKYSARSLNEIFKIITSVDQRIKTGELPVNILIDYLMVNTLSR